LFDYKRFFLVRFRIRKHGDVWFDTFARKNWQAGGDCIPSIYNNNQNTNGNTFNIAPVTPAYAYA